MKSTIDQLIKEFNPATLEETKQALREVVQNLVLVGLSKTDFFEKASFYGGTALRIFYNLNRFSEDLDFTLREKNIKFSIDDYFDAIKTTCSSYGLNVEVINKINTYLAFLNLKVDSKYSDLLHKDELLKIKIEVDLNPPLGFDVESKWLVVPEFAPISILNKESLFAGKIHAVLCRSYKNHVKGRDYYDFLYYVKTNTKPNLNYLRNKLIESNKIDENDAFDMNVLKKMLKERFETVNYDQIKEDMIKFTYSNDDLSYICKELFLDLVERL